jgi:excisionase family DNA binding protein
MTPTIYTLAEAAKILRIGMATAQRLASSGRLGGGKVGAQWRFTEADLLAGIRPVAPKAPAPQHAAAGGFAAGRVETRVIPARFSAGAQRAIAEGLLR